MFIKDYISKDYPAFNSSDKIDDANEMAKEFGYSHVFVKKKGVYQGAISQSFLDDSPEGTLGSLDMHFEKFAILDDGNLLDSIKLFHTFNCNVVPVISKTEKYLGYLCCDDIFNEFSKYPLFSENGAVMIVQTSGRHYSMTEVCKIVESNNGKLLGAFISKMDMDLVQITLKVSNIGLSDIIQTFRRYSYTIVSGHEEDSYLESLKDRSDYLNKYLNI